MNSKTLTTNLYAANLIDEGLYVERLIKENAELKDKISSGKPICPICLKVLEPFNYEGYYDGFSGYECGCEKFDKIPVSFGQYA